MKKIAIIFDGDLNNRKGFFNAVLERARLMGKDADYAVDVYCICTKENSLVRMLRHTARKETPAVANVDGVNVRVLWFDFSLIDYVLSVKLHCKAIFIYRRIKQVTSVFAEYDLLMAHSFVAGNIARSVNKKYGIPYVVTWHGSDIHTAPFSNSSTKALTADVLRNASLNFFVSEALRSTAAKICEPQENWKVSYNGVSPSFCKYSEEKRAELREKYGVSGKKVVAFVGGVVAIKNVALLPQIFSKIKEKYTGDVKFWVIGDGKLRVQIEKEIQALGLDCKFWGNQPPEMMPEYMNCMDLLLLPSKNEGLPLVVVEAAACGSSVAASDVGGIREAIGAENVVAHGADFIERYTGLSAELLATGSVPELSAVFRWTYCVEHEKLEISKFLK